MKRRRVSITLLFIFAFFNLQKSALVTSQSSSNDASVMASLKKSLELPDTLSWNDADPCNWDQVACNLDKRITRIQIGRQGVKGKLPSNLGNLTELQRLELQFNEISGPLPSLSGLSQLQALLLGSNGFTSIPHDMFEGMSSLQVVFLDDNPFSEWSIPSSLEGAVSLQNFSANTANVGGTLPGFLSGVANLHLSFNSISGGLPATFAGSSIQTLWINGQKLNGSVEVLKSMTNLQEGWLHSNEFTGAIPDLSELVNLHTLSLRDNQLTGVVPPSLLSLPSLKIVNLTNNELQGPFPMFGKSISADVAGANSFCSDAEGVACDPLVEVLLEVAGDVGYPLVFAQNWKGNSPCSPWLGITCVSGNITVINFQKMGLTGIISGNFSKLTSLQRIVLSNNNLTGTIPRELTILTHLKELDLSNNNLHGRIPIFSDNVVVKTEMNPDIGKESSTAGGGSAGSSSSSASSPATASPGVDDSPGGGKSTGVIVGTVAGVCMAAFIGFLGFFLYYKKRRPLGKVQSPSMGSEKSLISGRGEEAGKGMYMSSYKSTTMGSESHFSGEAHMMEPGRMVIPVSVLRSVTENFSEKNILGRGGFGTVYKGELQDGTKVAVKRMEAGAVSEKGLTEFKSEIDVLTKVRHRHLVGLLGHCLEGNERLLVYEYMPMGTLSSHLFYWKEDGLMPLDWSKRLVISLDVARGVEYLHGLAHQSFIHRDLKPSNILLGEDMRAKVADFGLVRLAPDGKSSFETRLAGTFGYLAPEYAVTGRVTTKVDVFSFGVILMEVITGRKALDESQPEESMHLVTWFRRMHVNKDMFRKAIDPTIDTDDDILASISTVSELAWHCCAREPYQRPDMGHVVNVLSSLVDRWNPSDHPSDDSYAIDFDLTLPQALKKWQSVDPAPDTSSSFSLDNTHTSIPICPTGFADTFNSDDAR